MDSRSIILKEIERKRLKNELNKLKNCDCPGKKSILERLKKIKDELNKRN